MRVVVVIAGVGLLPMPFIVVQDPALCASHASGRYADAATDGWNRVVVDALARDVHDDTCRGTYARRRLRTYVL